MRKPPDWAVSLLKPFGKSPSGEPRYKFAWADDVMEKYFGEEQKRFPEHAGHWLLMKFVEWVDYGEWHYDMWGPKPYVDGEYELSQVIAWDGMALELHELPQDVLLAWVVCSMKEKIPHRSEILNAKKEKLAARDREWRQTFSEIYDDAQRPFGANPVSGIPDKKMPEDSRIVTLDQLPEQIRKQLTRPGNIRQIS